MRHCRLCYGTGHNRRTCPNATPVQKQTYQQPTARMSNRRGARCSYCLRYKGTVDRTHNLRNCPEKQKDAVAWTRDNIPFAERFVEEFPKYGIGVGAIIRNNYDLDSYYVVTKMNWDNISGGSFRDAISATRLSEEDHEDSWNWRNFELPQMNCMGEIIYSNTTVVNPLPADDVRNQIPNDFKFGYYGMPDKLRAKTRKRRRR